MKFFLIAFAVIAAVAADVSHLPSNEYLPPVQEAAPVAAPTNEYLPPVAAVPVEAAPAHELADDGYRYKTNRRVVYRRNRRDVSHLPSNEYLPPVQESAPVAAPTNEYLPPVEQVEAAPAHELADDGYRYKTHRRVVYRRNRRDVSHLPSNEYLPPVQESAPVEVAPVEVAPVEEAAPAHELAADGYRYKTHRRVVYRRNRRDVSHLPSNEYLPPVEEAAPVEVAPVQEVSVVEEAAPAHELAADGYRYKTHRRVVYRRNRRDVSHLPSNEYLPPVEEAAPVEVAPVQEVSVVEEAAPAHELAADGYRYKTHRRVVYRRNRRDVSHLPSNEYLPPVEESAPVVDAPVQEVAVVEEAAPAHELAADGYRYKTHRRVVYRRNRRDVSHLPSNEYLPPVQQEAAPVAAPTNEYLPPVQQDEAAPAHELAADGYRYKTHRRVVYRRH
ncbi:early nodulin-75 isoform X2 [Lucilia cuprina]|uniref:early nodulin-75 isoform X2 n=1 Tax=Lucilia cuprina TaxID=7375 RepID=UPI001F05368C|nr:early nodulin-75 isoform X2 [Lucilia cuprina]